MRGCGAAVAPATVRSTKAIEPTGYRIGYLETWTCIPFTLGHVDPPHAKNELLARRKGIDLFVWGGLVRQTATAKSSEDAEVLAVLCSPPQKTASKYHGSISHEKLV